jgi:hypothetical protein
MQSLNTQYFELGLSRANLKDFDSGLRADVCWTAHVAAAPIPPASTLRVGKGFVRGTVPVCIVT